MSLARKWATKLAINPERNAAPFPIVGIGASAGGLRALENFFQAMPPAPGMAFVIITHLATGKAFSPKSSPATRP
jgi:chemotaxis response regulator CheB